MKAILVKPSAAIADSKPAGLRALLSKPSLSRAATRETTVYQDSVFISGMPIGLLLTLTYNGNRF